jgi:hypothetical protein
MTAAKPILLALALGLALACSGEPDSPEAQVRALLAEIEAAAEDGDVSAFKDLVSERYEDPYGHDKQALGAFMTFNVLRHQRGRQVILRTRQVTLPTPDRAAVTLHVGLAGAASGTSLRADVYQVELDLVQEDGDWRLTWAQWKPAPATDLL